MKKILKICSPQLGLSPNSDLGGEVHDHFILQGLADRGHKILVYLPRGREYQEHKNIKVDRVPIKHIPAIIFNFLILPYLIKTYKSEKFDVLRVHSPYYVGLGSIIFKLFFPKVKIIATYHLNEEGVLFDFINKIIINKFDRIIAVSYFLKKKLIEEYKVGPKKIVVIYNGVSPDLGPEKKDQSLVKKYNLSNKRTLIFIGLLIERKNPLFLLKVYKSLKLKNKNIALIICGRGKQKKEIIDYIDQNNLKDIHLVGRVHSKDKGKYINLSDILTIPSKNEGFGIVVAEAMACGKPVIISNNTSLSELVEDGVDGLLAETNNQNDWQNKAELLVRNNALREKLSKQALAKSKKQFNWSKAVLETEKVFMIDL